MDKQNRSSFEEEWSNSFEDVEVPPPGGVWDKVELSLANSANGSFKRRIIFFKFLAAASVAFALTVGGLTLYKVYYAPGNNNLMGEASQAPDAGVNKTLENNEDIPAGIMEGTGQAPLPSAVVPGSGMNNGKRPSTHPDGSLADASQGSNTDADIEKGTGEGGDFFSNATDPANALAGARTNETAADQVHPATTVHSLTDEEILRANEMIASAKEEETVSPGKEDDPFSGNELLPGKLEKRMAQLDSITLKDPELQMVPWYAYTNTNSKKSGDRSRLWAGVDVSAGSFDPPGTNSSPSFSTFEQSFVPTEDFVQGRVSDEDNGTSFNFGLNFGAQVASRWIVQSGVIFSDWNTSSNSNVVQETGQSQRVVNLDNVDELEAKFDLSPTQEYEISNSYRVISVPVQAGYLLLDRKVFITLLGGFSNDLLLSKKVEDESGTFDSQYVDDGVRTYNISGLLGTELGYTIGENYSISVMPQLRQSINSVSTTDPNMKPTFFEFGFRLKYIVR